MVVLPLGLPLLLLLLLLLLLSSGGLLGLLCPPLAVPLVVQQHLLPAAKQQQRHANTEGMPGGYTISAECIQCSSHVVLGKPSLSYFLLKEKLVFYLGNTASKIWRFSLVSPLLFSPDSVLQESVNPWCGRSA